MKKSNAAALAPTRIDEGDLLKTPAAAKVLGYSPDTLVLWRKRGVGPAFIRLSAPCVRYRRAALAEFVARCEAATTQPRTAA